jgi:hypothetical protein
MELCRHIDRGRKNVMLDNSKIKINNNNDNLHKFIS